MNMQQNFNGLDKPFREIIDLNVKTIQSFSYIKPAELMSANKPQQFLDKNVEMLIENGHKALDYVQNMFDIMEKHWSFMSREAVTQSREFIKEKQSAVQNSIKEGIKISNQVAERVASPVKSKKQPVKATVSATAKRSPVKAKSKVKAKASTAHSLSALSKETHKAAHKSPLTVSKTSKVMSGKKTVKKVASKAK